MMVSEQERPLPAGRLYVTWNPLFYSFVGGGSPARGVYGRICVVRTGPIPVISTTTR
jgi:hypothetical protein